MADDGYTPADVAKRLVDQMPMDALLHLWSVAYAAGGIPGYSGPATLQTDDVTVDVNVHLRTVDSDGVSTWAGVADSLDPAALRIQLQATGALVLPDGRSGDVYVAHTETDSGRSGVSLRLHGGGPAPY